MQNPKISIIIPVYNAEKYIARALESCIKQTLKEIEIIIVDDLGADRSIEIAQEFTKKDKRIKILHNQKNLRLLKARYEGAKCAQGEYIMFLDADDFLALEACELCYQAVLGNKNQDFDMVVFNINFQYRANEEYQIFGPIKYESIYTQEEFTQILLQTKIYYFWNLINKMYKKEFYCKTYEKYLRDIPFKIQMAEDLLAFATLLAHATRIKTINESLYYYFFNPSSTMNTPNPQTIRKNIDDLNFVGKEILSLSHNQPKVFEIWIKLCANTMRFNAFRELYKIKKISPYFWVRQYYLGLLWFKKRKFKKTQERLLRFQDKRSYF